MDRIQSLRKLALKLEVSGTAVAVSNTRLYKGCYNFVGLQAYVPVTQHRNADTLPLCTVHAVIIDNAGIRRQAGAKYYNMKYVETVKLGGYDYLLFERLLPKPFTDTAGDLELIINYSEITEDGKLAARLTTNIYPTVVYEGGEADGEIDVALTDQEAAQISANKIAIGELREDVAGLQGELSDSVAGLTDAIDAEQDRAEAAEAELSGRITAAETELDSLRNLGHFLGSYYYRSDVPSNKSDFPGGITVNDFASVRNDETHGGAVTRYVVTNIAGDGEITWAYDITYSTDITGKMDTLPGAPEDNIIVIGGSGNAKDSGRAVSDFASAEQGAKADAAIPETARGSPGGVATLDDAGKLPLEQLPITEPDLSDYYTKGEVDGNIQAGVTYKQDKAPMDGKRYVGRYGGWEEIETGSGGGLPDNITTGDVETQNPAAESVSGTATTQRAVNESLKEAINNRVIRSVTSPHTQSHIFNEVDGSLMRMASRRFEGNMELSKYSSVATNQYGAILGFSEVTLDTTGGSPISSRDLEIEAGIDGAEIYERSNGIYGQMSRRRKIATLDDLPKELVTTPITAAKLTSNPAYVNEGAPNVGLYYLTNLASADMPQAGDALDIIITHTVTDNVIASMLPALASGMPGTAKYTLIVEQSPLVALLPMAIESDWSNPDAPIAAMSGANAMGYPVGTGISEIYFIYMLEDYDPMSGYGETFSRGDLYMIVGRVEGFSRPWEGEVTSSHIVKSIKLTKGAIKL